MFLSHILQLLPSDPEVFPGHPDYLVTPACSESALSSLSDQPGRLVNVHREAY